MRLLLVLPAGLVILAGGCAGSPGSSEAPAPQTRTYYIAADEVNWDYAPSGDNRITGAPFDTIAAKAALPGPTRIGHIYRKSIYREYTDSTFRTLKPRDPAWVHLGILGPLIRGVVGDTLRVVFRNNTHYPATIHAHGVFYTKGAEGAPYNDSTSGADKADDAVPTGGTHLYVWNVPPRAGPGPDDGSSVMWMYHSHVNDERDLDSGLLGPIIITARDMARADGTPKDVDRELVVAFAEFDENQSWHLDSNMVTYLKDPAKAKVGIDPFGQIVMGPDFGANFKESMNGFIFGNTPGLTMKVGQRVRWYLMATTGFEIHAPHWHGNTVLIHGMRTDVTSLLPMGMVTADMVPDDPGIWMFHCHVGPHLMAGMQALYRVTP